MGQDIPEETQDPEDLKVIKEAVDELDKPGAKADKKADTKEEPAVEVSEKDTQAQLEEIKAYREVLGKEGVEPSPMLFLRRKELELKGKLLEAEKGAEIKVANARRKAARIRAEADETAAREGREYFAKEVEKTKEKGEEIKKSVEEEKKLVKATGQKNIEQAVKLVIRAVTLTE